MTIRESWRSSAAVRGGCLERVLVELRQSFHRGVQAADPVKALDQGVADIGAVGTAEPLMRLGLERQQREDMIDISAHFPGASGPPGPDRRRDIVNDGD